MQILRLGKSIFVHYHKGGTIPKTMILNYSSLKTLSLVLLYLTFTVDNRIHRLLRHV